MGFLFFDDFVLALNLRLLMLENIRDIEPTEIAVAQ
jgi:hypothetical protein